MPATIAQVNRAEFPYVEIALDVPIRQVFTYQVSDVLPPVGARVSVVFGRRKMLGVVVSHTKRAPKNIKLKTVTEVLDATSLFSENHRALISWAARYYHHPIGEVWQAALPGVLRKHVSQTHGLCQKSVSVTSYPQDWKEQLNRAPVQSEIFAFLCKQQGQVLPADVIQKYPNGRNAIKALIKRGWVSQNESLPKRGKVITPNAPNILTSAQQKVVSEIANTFGGFACSVLHGVTGSGKTEVYFGLIDKALSEKKQVLVMLPEIALTDQHAQRFISRFGSRVAQIHSGMSDADRYRVWWQVRAGQIDIVLTTRSGVFIPFKNLGLIIVDEEHDLSYKQQEGLRYHARSVAIKRAQLNHLPVVLGSATPSLETLHNVAQGRYNLVELESRIEGSALPDVSLVNLATQKVDSGLSAHTINEIKKTLAKKKQVLVFINRRGYAPVVYCPACQWTAQCIRCDANMTAHQHGHALQCHHCGATRAHPDRCESCYEDTLITLGEGTQKLEERLNTLFPDAVIQRFDRDKLNSAKKLHQAMSRVHDGQIDILIGTQLISKGHDFSGLHLVVVLNADQGLHSIDFRAPEQLVQQLIQVGGRAGRGKTKGQVLIQTQLVNHPGLNAVSQHNYNQFVQSELTQRKLANFPPYTHLALWRVRSRFSDQAIAIIQNIAQLGRACQPQTALCFDPVKSTMHKRAGQFHMQLLISANKRKDLHQWINNWIPFVEALKMRGVHWSIDIDPISLL